MPLRGKGKRKKSQSPNSGRVDKTKKLKVNNKLPLNASQVSLAAPTTSQARPATRLAVSQPLPVTPTPIPHTITQDPAPEKTVKPVFVNAGILVIRNVIQKLKFAAKPLLKVRGNASTQVLCYSIDDKKILIAKLRSEQIGFHTFTDASDKPTYFLLKGFYHASCAELLSTLQASKVPATKVTDFIRNDNYVIYLVHVDKAVNVNMLNHSYKHVDGIVVRWDVLRKSNKKITQCFKCQSWGHSADNCGYIPRCVKCSDSHAKGECPRTTRVGDPTCCNCGGPHASNHRGCPAYKQHLEKIKSRAKKPSTVPHRNPVPLNSSSHFPSLDTQQSRPSSIVDNPSQSVSFARILSDSNSSVNSFAKLSQAQAKLNSIPNINETINVFVKMVDELSLCTDQSSQLNILLKYTTSFSLSNNGS